MQKKISFGKVDGYYNGKKQCEVVLELNLKEREDGKPVFTVCGNVYKEKYFNICIAFNSFIFGYLRIIKI